MRVGPRPGGYGPVAWTVARPSTLWAYAGFATANTLLTFAHASRDIVLLTSWAFELGLLYLLLRGSKLMWWIAIVLDTFGILTTAAYWVGQGLSEAPPGPYRGYYVIHSALLTAGVFLLLHPSTRRFYDLEWRRSHLTPPVA